MKRAKRGLLADGGAEEESTAGDDAAAPALSAAGSSDATGSVFVFIFWIAVHVFEERFVHGGLADYVFFASPRAEVEQFAALAAKRKFGISVGVRGFLADGAAVLHKQRIPQTAGGCAGVVS